MEALVYVNFEHLKVFQKQIVFIAALMDVYLLHLKKFVFVNIRVNLLQKLVKILDHAQWDVYIMEAFVCVHSVMLKVNQKLVKLLDHAQWGV
jgi:hypothetical protein